MLLLGGPAGIAIIAGLALYKLAQGHDAAGKAAKDHAAEMEELRETVQKTTDDIEELNATSRNEALARWTEKLNIAQENIREVTKQLRYGAIGGFWISSRFGRIWYLFQVRRAFQTEITVEEYQDALWALAANIRTSRKMPRKSKSRFWDCRLQNWLHSVRAINWIDCAWALRRRQQHRPIRKRRTPTQPAAPQQLGDKEEEKIRSYIQELKPCAALRRVITARPVKARG